jgi:xylulokinase
VDAGSVAAKIAWLAVHQRARLDAATWMLTPRDLVVWWLTGTVATDATMAWRSGLYDGAGGVVAELAGPAASKLAPVVPPDQVTGHLDAAMAGPLGLDPGTPVVVGAGDRACEVLGSGADAKGPMASWGTTANVSLPLRDRPDRVPPGLVVSAGATGGWLLEGGLSGAGSLLDWLGRLTGRTPADLAALADGVAPGAGGVVATPWLDGARAPWWRGDARAALVGMSPSHGPAELARAVVESVAFDLQRCLEVMAGRPGTGAPLSRLMLGGAGASVAVWGEVVTAVTGLPAEVRGSGQAASAGAALLAARALGLPWELDVMDPVDRRIDAEPAAVRRYRALRPAADRVAASVLALGDGPDEPSKPPEGPEPACD